MAVRSRPSCVPDRRIRSVLWRAVAGYGDVLMRSSVGAIVAPFSNRSVIAEHVCPRERRSGRSYVVRRPESAGSCGAYVCLSDPSEERDCCCALELASRQVPPLTIILRVVMAVVGCGPSVRSAQLRPERARRRSRRRRRSRSSRSPRVVAGFPRRLPPDHAEVWRASPPREAHQDPCRGAP